ncbi:MAG TPA: hypothetical protein GX004_07890 [Firmicutes bacterium]|jgi:hypothetical protein|nr:hypothetical protein [Bacillota bacterium]
MPVADHDYTVDNANVIRGGAGARKHNFKGFKGRGTYYICRRQKMAASVAVIIINPAHFSLILFGYFSPVQ